jgi:sterol desaturase/sphingolipid hydroxylase (fatty acid hydroxylase superfamily)
MTSTDSIRTLIDKSKDYLDTNIELTKLKTIDKSADVLSTVVVMVSMLFVLFLAILFASLALALLLGKMLGAYHYGFFIMAGFYAIILLVLYIKREKWIKTPVANELINKMLK